MIKEKIVLEIYLSPDVLTPHFHIINVVNGQDKVLGNIAFLFDEKKLFVYGILEEEGVSENFKDIVQPYIKGLAKAKPDLEVYSCLYVGCKKISLNATEEEKEK